MSRCDFIVHDIREFDFTEEKSFDTVVWDQPFNDEQLFDYIPSSDLNFSKLLVFSDSKRVGVSIDSALKNGWIFWRQFCMYTGGRFRGSDGVLEGFKIVSVFHNGSGIDWIKPKYLGKEFSAMEKVKISHGNSHGKDSDFIGSLLIGIQSKSVLDCFCGGGGISKACFLAGIDFLSIDKKRTEIISAKINVGSL